MDAITSAVISIGMERQSQQLQANASLVREAKKSDAAVLELLDAAKATGQLGSGQSTAQGDASASGKGSILNLLA